MDSSRGDTEVVAEVTTVIPSTRNRKPLSSAASSAKHIVKDNKRTTKRYSPAEFTPGKFSPVVQLVVNHNIRKPHFFRHEPEIVDAHVNPSRPLLDFWSRRKCNEPVNVNIVIAMLKRACHFAAAKKLCSTLTESEASGAYELIKVVRNTHFEIPLAVSNFIETIGFATNGLEHFRPSGAIAHIWNHYRKSIDRAITEYDDDTMNDPTWNAPAADKFFVNKTEGWSVIALCEIIEHESRTFAWELKAKKTKPFVPDIPVIAESGIGGSEASSITGLSVIGHPDRKKMDWHPLIPTSGTVPLYKGHCHDETEMYRHQYPSNDSDPNQVILPPHIVDVATWISTVGIAEDQRMACYAIHLVRNKSLDLDNNVACQAVAKFFEVVFKYELMWDTQPSRNYANDSSRFMEQWSAQLSFLSLMFQMTDYSPSPKGSLSQLTSVNGDTICSPHPIPDTELSTAYIMRRRNPNILYINDQTEARSTQTDYASALTQYWRLYTKN